MSLAEKQKKFLMLAVITFVGTMFLLFYNLRTDSEKYQKNPCKNLVEEQQNLAKKLESDGVDSKEDDTSLLQMCPNYKEFRSVNFQKPEFRHTLCRNAETYKLMSDGYPICVLSNPFNDELISVVKNNSETMDYNLVVHNSKVKLFVFKGNETTSLIYKTNKTYWETDQIKWLVRFALKFKPQVTFLDIGSNLGAYTMEAARMGLPVVSLEANIRNALRVQLSLDAARLKADVVWNFIALDHKLKYMTFPMACSQSFSSGMVNLGVRDTVPIMPVGGDKLRSLINTKYVVMKVDIEGGETDFLKTSSRLFSDFNVTAVQMEWNPEFVRGFDSRYMMKFFTDRGYRPWRVPGFHGLDIKNITSLGSIEVLWVRKEFVHMV